MNNLAYESQLGEDIASFATDLYGFVLYAFPWGEGGLKDKEPDDWQVKIMLEVQQRLEAGEDFGAVLKFAVSSGHGVGKSAFVAWLILWAMSTHADTRGVVTANTETQLRTKTWAELAKWYHMCVTKHWFIFTATALYSCDVEHEKTWRIDMVPWSEKNTEAFAGLHNEGKRILLIFDEASAIHDIIWEVSEGALTDDHTEIMWFCFGNPTNNTGRFKSCFTRFRHRWITKKIDSRTVAITNKTQLQEWVDDYGEDHDFVRVRVRGEFPRAGSTQLINGEVVEAAVEREIDVVVGAPKLFGVDVARFGDDYTCIVRRHGRKVEEVHRYRGLDTMQVSAKVAELINVYRPDAVMVDEVGLGAGVVDRLKQLHFDIIPVNSARIAEDERQFVNKRAEMWGRMKEWLEGADIPRDAELIDDLIGPQYTYDTKMRIQLESKKDMKRRGIASPDAGDALALTFAFATPPVHVYSDEDCFPEWAEDI